MNSIEVCLDTRGFVRKPRIIGQSNCGFAWFKHLPKQGEAIVEVSEDSIAIWLDQELLFCTANKSAAILRMGDLLDRSACDACPQWGDGVCCGGVR